MNWDILTTLQQLDLIDQTSENKAVLIYKHSTRCNICNAVESRLERNWNETMSTDLDLYFLDLLQHRDVSNEIAKRYSITHQSPQVLIIKNGKCIYHESQMAINMRDIISEVRIGK